jgi:hypothetical protein
MSEDEKSRKGYEDDREWTTPEPIVGDVIPEPRSGSEKAWRHMLRDYLAKIGVRDTPEAVMQEALSYEGHNWNIRRMGWQALGVQGKSGLFAYVVIAERYAKAQRAWVSEMDDVAPPAVEIELDEQPVDTDGNYEI